MANIMDYLDWRGDLTWEADSFNEVDNLILSELVYVEFDGIVPADGEDSISLEEAASRFFEKKSEAEIMAKVSMTKMASFVLKKAAQTKRFAKIRLSHYVNDIDESLQSQFSVLCMTLPDETMFVAYSGTDSTIVGWRENFNMGYLEETPGQRKAVSYLNRIMEKRNNLFRMGGHSKGGNLSVYAAAMCNPAIQKRLLAAYSNDGPGFRREIIESAAYQSVAERICRIVPEASIVGMLLEHEPKYKVVKSTEHGALQHDAMSWEVLGRNFVYASEIAPESLILDKTIKNWLEQLDAVQKRQIVETAFSVLEAADIHTVDDFYNSKIRKIQEIIKVTSNLPEDTQKLFGEAIRLLWKSGNSAVREHRKEKNENVKNI